MAASALAIVHNTVPPTANPHDPDPECDLDYTPNTARERRTDTVLSVGSGFGGFQSAIVLTRPARGGSVTTASPVSAPPRPAATRTRTGVVTGIGVAAPNGLGAAAWWAAVLRGESGIGPLTLFDASGYPVRLAGEVPGFVADHVSSRLLPQTDRVTRLSLAVAREALLRRHHSGRDPRYEELATRGHNKRFTARSAAFRVATTTEEVVRAVGEAARRGRRVAVRSSGHCYENFVGDPAVRLVIDLGEMNAVAYDPRMRAVMIESGARLMDVYRRLHDTWGVTLPCGASATVAIGGHVAGGGYGALSRRFGVAADHVYAVEVVVADATGRARAVVATREPGDPHRELWWAHTGGGGGNFGVVTRYWFRSPGAIGDNPARLLPRPPAETLSSALVFPREGMDRAAMRRLVGNFGRWHERNSGAGSPYADLYGGLVLFGRLRENDPGQSAISFTHLDAGVPDADRLLERYTEGVAVTPYVPGTTRVPWFTATTELARSQDAEHGRQKIKSAYLRHSLTDRQIDALFTHLDSADHSSEAASVSLQSYGGRINTVPSSATATAHRNAVVNVIFMNTWQDPEADAENIGWLRRIYRDAFATTGGVPVPGRGGADGCYINYPDLDMADPEWNTSGVPWHRLYYKDNYTRLRRIKAEWDPGHVFGHDLGVRPG